MSTNLTKAHAFPRRRPSRRLFEFDELPLVDFPIQEVRIDWKRLVAKRPLLLETLDEMPKYLLKPEVLELLEYETNPMHNLVLDLMWTTGARISEVLAINPASFQDDGYEFGVILKTLKQGPGRPSKRSLQRSPKRTSQFLNEIFKNGFTAIFTWGSFERTRGFFRLRARPSVLVSIGSSSGVG